VYVATNPDEATIYAALAPGGGRGHVCEVKPVEELEPDPAGALGTTSYATRAATVVAVVRRGLPFEEAV
jgi:hypothetical protein